MDARLKGVQCRGRSICSLIDRVDMFAGVVGGKPAAGSPRSAAVLCKIETRWSRFLMPGRGEVGAGVVFLRGLHWWEAMSRGGGGHARPNNKCGLYGRRNRAESDVVLINVGGGGQRGAEACLTIVIFFDFF